jgi:hypothetical protein
MPKPLRGIRRVWKIKPSLRIKESKKIYNRHKLKQELIKNLKKDE